MVVLFFLNFFILEMSVIFMMLLWLRRWIFLLMLMDLCWLEDDESLNV